MLTKGSIFFCEEKKTTTIITVLNPHHAPKNQEERKRRDVNHRASSDNKLLNLLRHNFNFSFLWSVLNSLCIGTLVLHRFCRDRRMRLYVSLSHEDCLDNIAALQSCSPAVWKQTHGRFLFLGVTLFLLIAVAKTAKYRSDLWKPNKSAKSDC